MQYQRGSNIFKVCCPHECHRVGNVPVLYPQPTAKGGDSEHFFKTKKHVKPNTSTCPKRHTFAAKNIEKFWRGLSPPPSRTPQRALCVSKMSGVALAVALLAVSGNVKPVRLPICAPLL